MADILDFTKPHVLRNEEEYNCAVTEIEELPELLARINSPDHN